LVNEMTVATRGERPVRTQDRPNAIEIVK